MTFDLKQNKIQRIKNHAKPKGNGRNILEMISMRPVKRMDQGSKEMSGYMHMEQGDPPTQCAKQPSR